MNTIVQSLDEVLRLVDEWFRVYKPENVVTNKKNATLLVDTCLTKFGLISISYLTETAEAIAGQLDLTPAPVAKTSEQLAADEIARQHRDYMESIKPQPDFHERAKQVQDKAQAEKNAKVQEDAMGQLAVAISGYQCYRINAGGIDYSATELVQKELSTVVSRSPNGQRDYVRTLAVVRQIIQELPDHPKMGDVARVVESLNARSLDAAQANQPKDSFGSDVKKTGKLGGLR
jgi:hypothetical protein